jgi:hypothetical protein
MTYWRFSVPGKSNQKIPINSGFQQAVIACPQKMALGSLFHQMLHSDLSFFQYWAILTKSSPGIRRISKFTSQGLKNAAMSL